MATAYTEYVYRSTDSGATWTELSGVGVGQWIQIACSDDGGTIVAGEDNGTLKQSTDAGATWTTLLTGFWTAVAVSADGRRTIAGNSGGGGGGYIYIGLSAP